MVMQWLVFVDSRLYISTVSSAPLTEMVKQPLAWVQLMWCMEIPGPEAVRPSAPISSEASECT